MLHLLLSIMIIVGKILILILILLCVILLLILFGAINYQGYFEKQDKIIASLRVSYLFHMFTLNYNYPKPGKLSFKFLWFNLFSKTNIQKDDNTSSFTKKEKRTTIPPQSSKSSSKNASTRNAKNEAKAPSTQNTISSKATADTKNIPAESVNVSKNTTKIKVFVDTIKIFFKYIYNKLHRFEYTISNLCDKIKKVISSLSAMKDFWKEETTQTFVFILKKTFTKLWKHIRPRKSSGLLHFGLEDPSDTGYMMALLSVCYPYIDGDFQIQPEFEHEIFEAKIEIRGHIRLFFLLYAILIVYSKGHFKMVKERFEHSKEIWRFNKYE